MATRDVEVRRIDLRDRRALETFIRFPWKIYPRSSHWCPPLLSERREFLDPARNPFFGNAAVELFVAWRGGEPVGRISACEDRRSNEYRNERVVSFGFFESIDDDRVASALLDAVAAWGSARGLQTMRGPGSFNSNHEFGLLVSPFDAPPSIGMPYNPDYYPRLLERARMEKVKDLYMWWLGYGQDASDLSRLEAVGERLQRRARVRLRRFEPARWDEELACVLDIYNEAWKDNWGFVPLDRDEFSFLAKQLRHIMRPELAFIAEDDGRPVAFSLTVPDANQAIRPANGRMVPFGFFKVLRALRRIDALRLMLLGIRDGYRRRGIETLFFAATYRAGLEAGRFKGGEIGWTLEDNHLINSAIRMMGGTHTKTYRVYELPI